jgi:hypothetical protein
MRTAIAGSNGMVGSEDACYAFDIVQAICTEVGPGLPGSAQEWERATLIKKELESHLGSGNVTAEEFTVAPGAMLSAYPMSALFMLIAALLNISIGRFTGVSPWLTAVAALAFSILAPLPFIFLFIFNYEWVDRFFQKKQSVNVIGTLRKPETIKAKRLLILSGHHDSARANTWFGILGNVKRLLVRDDHQNRAREDAWLRFLGYVFYFLSTTWFIGLITLLAMSIIQVMGLITGNADIVRIGTLGWAMLAYPIVPAIIFPMFFTRGKKNGGIVPGAADNLSASALAVAMCRFLVKNPAYIPTDTEIRFISFGSEEAGVRGSRRYVERHLDELKRLDARLLNFETVAHPEIVILSSEGNGTVKNSPEMIKSVAAAAERAGVPYQVKPPWLGAGSDAAPFSQAGLKATTLLPFQMPQQMVDFYHQKWDRPEILSIEPLLNVLKLTFEWVRNGGE